MSDLEPGTTILQVGDQVEICPPGAARGKKWRIKEDGQRVPLEPGSPSPAPTAATTVTAPDPYRRWP